MFIRACVAVVFGGLSVSTIAAPRAVDAKQLDIAGVKLGMSAEQAVAAVKENMQLDNQEISFDPFPQPSIVTKQKEPTYFEVRAGATALTVHLTSAVPFNPEHKLVVSRITFKQPWTQTAERDMQQDALQKYGEPSNGDKHAHYQWCQQPSDGMQLSCNEFQGAKLELEGSQLTLSDPSYREAVNHYRRQRASG